MSSEIVNSAKSAVAVNEYPDVVGTKPTAPQAAAFRAFIGPETTMPELTARALIVGTLLGMVFGA